jgi:hypothetical protein
VYNTARHSLITKPDLELYPALSVATTELLLGLLAAAGTSPQALTDGQRLDLWAARIAVWRATLPDLHAPVSSLPHYINCGVFRSQCHTIVDHYVRAYMIWVSPEPIPFSVYKHLARRRQWVEELDAELAEDVELNDWLTDFESRSIVGAIRVNGSAWNDTWSRAC